MSSVSSLFEPGWGNAEWRARAERLFQESDRASSPIGRELLRRRAVAAENIADAMEIKV
jgi:hypothetical protein